MDLEICQLLKKRIRVLKSVLGKINVRDLLEPQPELQRNRAKKPCTSKQHNNSEAKQMIIIIKKSAKSYFVSPPPKK